MLFSIVLLLPLNQPNLHVDKRHQLLYKGSLNKNHNNENELLQCFLLETRGSLNKNHNDENELLHCFFFKNLFFSAVDRSCGKLLSAINYVPNSIFQLFNFALTVFKIRIRVPLVVTKTMALRSLLSVLPLLLT